MKNEPIRHHYIPRFILKNFCIHGTDYLWYFDKQIDELSKVKTRDVFMVRNLYRDEINTPENPTEIERDLAVYENEISQILKEKILTGDEIVLTLDENEKLKLFFAIMSFRSKATNQMFGEQMKRESKKFYKHYQKKSGFSRFMEKKFGIYRKMQIYKGNY